jgi:transcriptional regulator with XRE-family HTH domain
MPGPAKGSPRIPKMDRWYLYERVGQRMRQVRTEQGKSATEVALAAGTTAGTLCRIENAETPCPLHILVGAARALGVTLNDLVPQD